MLNVLLVTTWGTACGIAEHSAMLKEAVEAADPDIRLEPSAEALDPSWLWGSTKAPDVVHLNYHAALHSRWTVEAIRKMRGLGIPVLVTYHDTGVPNSDQCQAVVAAADYTVVHEPFEDLPIEKTEYRRQGILGWPRPGWHFSADWRASAHQPVVGSAGFPFPWKNYPLLCDAARLAGWAVYLAAPGATPEQELDWHSRCPHLVVNTVFQDRDQLLAELHACDATAFLYNCANTGTSGAIRLGIAARKPVLALSGCRQFRDLELDEHAVDWRLRADGYGTEAEAAVYWIENGTVQGIAGALEQVPIGGPCYPPMVALASRDSWTAVATRYAAIYRALAEGRPPRA